MKKLLMVLVSSTLMSSAVVGMADEHEGEGAEPNVATPVELYTCKYNEGQDAKDLAAAHKKFNEWADEQGITDYAAWSLVPFYAGPEQDFDVLWLGGSSKAETLGRVQGTWLAKGADEQEAFNEVVTCDSHGAYAALRMKKPPKRDNPSSIVVSFSDCNMAEDVSFSDMYMPLIEWGKYKGEHGSSAGMWVFFAAYGGGGEEFDFKWVTAHQNLADMGADWDQYSESGWEKGNELFAGKLSCDSSRTYLATSVRMAEEEEED